MARLPAINPVYNFVEMGQCYLETATGVYTLPSLCEFAYGGPQDLIGELEWTIAVQDTLRKEKKARTIVDIDTYRAKESITTFMGKCGLLEDLCLKLLRGGHIRRDAVGIIEIDRMTIEGYEETVPVFTQTACELLQKKGLLVLAYRERHLLELLGASAYDTAVRREQALLKRESAGG